MGKTYLKLAVVYFSIGVIMGIVMGIVHDFRLASVHAHINLLGWVSMALFGLIYHFYPSAANSKLAKIQFWLHNVGLPVMMIGIAAQTLTGSTAFLPVAIIGSIVLVVGVLLFAVNVFQHVGKDTDVRTGTNVQL